MWAAHLGAQIWPWCVEPPDVGWKMGTPSAWWGTHQRLNDHQILQKSCQRLLGKGFFLPKTVRIDGFLRENSWRDNAAAGLLGFCLNFILLGKKCISGSMQGCFAGGKLLCGCALWDCVHIPSFPGAPSPICGVCRRGPQPTSPKGGTENPPMLPSMTSFCADGIPQPWMMSPQQGH